MRTTPRNSRLSGQQSKYCAEAECQFDDEEELRKWCGETFGLRDMPKIKFVEPVASGGAGASGAGGAAGPKPGAPTSNAGKSPAKGAGNVPGK